MIIAGFTTEIKGVQDARERRPSRMSKAIMSEISRDMEAGRRRRCGGVQRVEITVAITAEENLLDAHILNGKTKRVKFDKHIIITSETTNTDEVLD